MATDTRYNLHTGVEVNPISDPGAQPLVCQGWVVRSDFQAGGGVGGETSYSSRGGGGGIDQSINVLFYVCSHHGDNNNKNNHLKKFKLLY